MRLLQQRFRHHLASIEHFIVLIDKLVTLGEAALAQEAALLVRDALFGVFDHARQLDGGAVTA